MRINNDFYRQSAIDAAPALLGKLICKRNEDNRILKMRITETECYMGVTDTGCHASRGKTERNSPLWLEGGFTYVYLCYGMYNMFNVITGNEGDPQGVLIRGVEGFDGPGKFTKYAGIDRVFNRIDLRTSDLLWIEDDGACPEYDSLVRVGIGYAEKEDRERLWRFRSRL